MEQLSFVNPKIARIPSADREALRILLVAKHVFWEGGLHGEDGNHAIYHVEMRDLLRELFPNLRLANSYTALFEDPQCDFVFPLLNRGGFLNSEMLLPLLATRQGLPFLGASPILRGIGDDKHASKLEAKVRGIPTLPWGIFRRGAPIDERECPKGDRLVVKPNASSASWGVRDAGTWAETKQAIEEIQDEGHDVIVEPFVSGHDIEVPVIHSGDRPARLPLLLFEQSDPEHLRSYQEKRELVDQQSAYRLLPFRDEEKEETVTAYARRMADVFFPFDYGRFEFRFDAETGDIWFLEVNLNCNLWSQKVFGQTAKLLGWTHADMIETILCESLARQGLVEQPERAMA